MPATRSHRRGSVRRCAADARTTPSCQKKPTTSATGRRRSGCGIIDPLDGTSEFCHGTADWAVHVALTVDGRPTAAAVAIPARDELFRSDDVEQVGGSLTGHIAVSRYGGSYESAHVANALGLQRVSVGSAGAKAMAVVRGDVDAYVHAGGQYEWNNCAPVGVCEAAGLHCSRLDGSEIIYNQRMPYMPDFVICRREITDDVLSALDNVW